MDSKAFEKHNKVNTANTNMANYARSEARALSHKMKVYNDLHSKPNFSNKNQKVSNSKGFNSINNNSDNSRNNAMNPFKNSNYPKNNESLPKSNDLSAKNNNSAKSNNNTPSKNSQTKNKIASKGLQTLGVPKGISDRIINSRTGKNGKPKSKSNMIFGLLDSFMGGSENQKEESNDSLLGGVNFIIPKKVIRYLIIASIPTLTAIVFICLFVTASQTYLSAVSLGNAETMSGTDADDKIKDTTDDDRNQEIKDEDAYNNLRDEKSLNFMNSKLNIYNLIKVTDEETNVDGRTIDRKGNEAKFIKLRDFYYDQMDSDKKYNDSNVKSFFSKLYYVYLNYVDNYDVVLDLPLLMSTLKLQSSDMRIIFDSNLSEYEVPTQEQIDTQSVKVDGFDYYDDWSGYNITKNNSEHDIEVLAQHMISKQVTEKCINASGKTIKKNVLKDNQIGQQTLKCESGEDYQTSSEEYKIDNKKYKEFLREFLEKKYYLSGTDTNKDQDINISCSNQNNPFKKYNLTEEQLKKIASVCEREQGSPKGAAAEASLMANLFELNTNGKGATAFYNYIRTTSWFGSDTESDMDSHNPTKEILAAVRSVLVDGYRTLPGYINEHDCWDCNTSRFCSNGNKGDICKISVKGKAYNSISDIKNTTNYIKNKTKIYSIYYKGAYYTFYSFPAKGGDPFGYNNEAARKKIGEFYYKYGTTEGKNCEYESGTNNVYVQAMLEVANHEYETKQGRKIEVNKKIIVTEGEKYNKYGHSRLGSAWCANFITWVVGHAKVNGKPLYPSVIPFVDSSTSALTGYFKSSKKKSISYHANTNCGKSSKNSYTPKPGDYVFYDWSDNDGKVDHVGIVEKYKNGVIHTIEGNWGNEVAKVTHKSNECIILGYGSWY